MLRYRNHQNFGASAVFCFFSVNLTKLGYDALHRPPSAILCVKFSSPQSSPVGIESQKSLIPNKAFSKEWAGID